MPDYDVGSAVSLPEISVQRRTALGALEHVIQGPRSALIAERTEIRVSPRKSETLLVLEGGERVILTERAHCPRPNTTDGVLLLDEEGIVVRWVFHRSTDPIDAESWQTLAMTVQKSWSPGINYSAEQTDSTGRVTRLGLRPPQIGALHAIAAHWTLSHSPGTIVMPTGTGKTEAMIAAMVSAGAAPVLVVVPSRPLRDQTVRKFRTLGLLQELGVISESFRNPVVGTITRRPRDKTELDDLVLCNVVVATMSAVSQGTAREVHPELAQLFQILMVDEAHHVAATTWGELRDSFGSKKVLQFTATPFRRDGILVDGDVLYSYPLRRAQEDGYFRPIQFDPVCELDLGVADEAIADKALTQLETDIGEGLDHLILARCDSIRRAEDVVEIYERLGARFAPTIVHSKLPDAAARVRKVVERKSRVVVCVDMLGEGFDLPNLKVAAIHDTHKSLAVLLQFAGRFTRSAGERIGDATVIANIADQDVADALERLYSEDADWNLLLAEMSSEAIREHEALVAFLNESQSLHDEAGGDLTAGVSPSLLRPRFSAAAFRVTDFTPKAFHRAISKNVEAHRAWLHEGSSTLYFVTKSEPSVRWTRAKSIRDREWHLFVLHHDTKTGLLFIHSSDKSSLHEGLAKEVSGGSAQLLRGDLVFRTLANINRLQFQNIGITKHARRNLRYAMYTGSDVKNALEVSQTANATKSNLQGSGFEMGSPVSVGCSYKGRVWSKQAGAIRYLLEWCQHVGAKLVDDSIQTDDIIENVMIPEEVSAFPPVSVLSIEWPIEFLQRREESIQLSSADWSIPLSLVELAFVDVSADRKTLRFHLDTPKGRFDFEFTLGPGERFDVRQAGGDRLTATIGRLQKRLDALLSEWPPLVRFVDLSELDGNLLIRPRDVQQRLTIPDERFEVWDWSGVDVTRESLFKDGAERPDSVQAAAAKYYIDGKFDIVFDDDAAGEAADLICLKDNDDHIRVALVHCKFAGAAGRAQVADVTEVCRQAVRSGRWLWDFKALCQHVLGRERRLKSTERASRFLRGDVRSVNALVRASRFKEIRSEIVVVQPGVSKSGISEPQSVVVAAAHAFLKDTVGVPLDIVCST